MLICCPKCKTYYRIVEAILGAAGRKVRCARCGHFWFQSPDNPAEPPPPPPQRVVKSPVSGIKRVLGSPIPAPKSVGSPLTGAAASNKKATAADSASPFAGLFKGVDDTPRDKAAAAARVKASKVDNLSDDDLFSSFGANRSDDEDEDSAGEDGGEVLLDDADEAEENNYTSPAPTSNKKSFNKPNSEEDDDEELKENSLSFDDEELIEVPLLDIKPDIHHFYGSSSTKYIWIARAIIAAAVISVGSFFWYGRYKIVEFVPFVRGAYELFGVSAFKVGEGLKFTNINRHRFVQDDVLYFEVRGYVLNENLKKVELPLLQLALYDEEGVFLQEKVIEPPVPSLESGIRVGFVIRMEAPSRSAAYPVLSFKEKPKK